MGIIADLKPLNLAQEKERFFADFSYNPQFEYIRKFTTKELQYYGQADEDYYLHALSMIMRHGIGTQEAPPFCTQEEVVELITNTLDAMQIPLPKIIFSADILAAARVVSNEIVFRLPLQFGKKRLESLVNHELQTHYLRRYNQSQHHPLVSDYTDKRIHFLPTEEGLANLHSHIDRNDILIRKTYLNYLASYWSLTDSFSTIFSKLCDLGMPEEKAWTLTIKQKRGLTDTSQPGGYTKNHVYFEGTVAVGRWIVKEQNDPRLLYLGRISLRELPQVQRATGLIEQLPDVKLPTFMHSIKEYKQAVASILEDNELDRLLTISVV